MRSSFGCLLLISILLGCTPTHDAGGSIEVKVGPRDSQARNFDVTTSLAEYIEIPGVGNELRLLLASYAASCDAFVPPPDGEVSVSVVITTPPGLQPVSGVYPWLGHAAHGGEVHAPAKAYSFPTTRLGHKSFQFQPGGGVVLNGLNLNKHGSVSGLLNFEFSGDAKHPATSLKGRFSARVCRFSANESS